jgi:16S rRNA (guanine527-N7)-methyltransferase
VKPSLPRRADVSRETYGATNYTQLQRGGATEESIGRVLDAMGVVASKQQVLLLALHLKAVLRANAQLNLTSVETEIDAIDLHVADSLTALPLVETAPAGRLVDLGSGAGYPGLPLGVMSGRPVTLVEARRKKAAFLAKVVDDLRFEADVLPVRAEELALDRPGCYAVAVARAVAPLPSLVELAAPLLGPGGVLIAMKGAPGADEIARGDEAAAIVGLDRVALDEVALPGRPDRRTLVAFRRVAAASVPLPRRSGLAQHRPLA